MPSSDAIPTHQGSPLSQNSFAAVFRGAIWLVGGTSLSLAAAWLAFQIQQRGVAPIVLFPLLVGAVVGIGIAAISRYTLVDRAWVLLFAAVIWGFLACLGQDLFGYWHERTSFLEARHDNPMLELVHSNDLVNPPRRFDRFDHYFLAMMQHQPLWWSLDLALTTAASAGAVLAARTIPAQRLTEPHPLTSDPFDESR